MSIRLVVLPQRNETQFAPLAVLGYCLMRTNFFAPLQAVDLNIKTVEHQPHQKLQDIVVSILANCSSNRAICESGRTWCWPKPGAASNLPNNRPWPTP